MRVFKCRDCALKNINTHLYSLLTSLVHLDLGGNMFKYISSDEFRGLRRLKVLRLDGNQLPVILEGTFSGESTPNLQSLILSRNRLAKVTAAAFVNLTTLVELNLSYNKLDIIETSTCVPLAESLRSLDISGNNIPVVEFKYILQVLVNLKNLSIADMSLGRSDIPWGLFIYLENLAFLNLSGNHFMSVPEQLLVPLPNLKELDLSRNNLQGLSERLLRRLERVPMLHLEKNPWTCVHCHIDWMLSVVKQNFYIRNVVCAMPYSIRGRTLGSLGKTPIEWCSNGLDYGDEGVAGLTSAEESQFGIITGSAVVIVLVTVIIFCVIYARNKGGTERMPTHELQIRDCETEITRKVTVSTIDELSSQQVISEETPS